jgi:SAM-dependent methyltransferase
MLKQLLAHPLTCSMDIDDPLTTWLRRRIIEEKPFLRKIYEEWYGALARSVPRGTEPVVEIGSGAGFLDTFIPDLITSEVFHCSNVKMVLDAAHLPFRDGSLRAVVMTNVLHHLPRPRSFLAEAARCVRPGGALAMIEPWVSPWSTLIYRYLHHEPFRPESDEWEFPSSGPLTGANGAVPWIIFERDREKFEREFPEWKIQYVKPSMPFCYLFSGGVSMRSLMPGAAFNLVRRVEERMQPLMKGWAMFAEIRLERVEPAAQPGGGDLR